MYEIFTNFSVVLCCDLIEYKKIMIEMSWKFSWKLIYVFKNIKKKEIMELLLLTQIIIFFFYRFKWKENGQTDLPYANPFTISTIPALSGATVDKFSKPTTVNSKMVCKQLIIILKVKYDIPNVSPARYDIFLKRKIFYFFLLYLLSIRYHV